MEVWVIYELICVWLVVGEILCEQVIDDLENLCFCWCGDSIEFDIICMLGEFYGFVGEFGFGFEVMVCGQIWFEDNEVGCWLFDDMNDIFCCFFFEGEVDWMDLVEVVVLFYQYQYFVLIGMDGDCMICWLVDCLIVFDLFDLVVEFLQYQVDNCLSELLVCVCVVIDLVVVYLMDYCYEDVMNMICCFCVVGLLCELVNECYLLEVCVLLEMGWVDIVLELIVGDISFEVVCLCVDIVWENCDWLVIGCCFECILVNRFQDLVLLMLFEQNDLMWVVIVYLFFEDCDSFVCFGQCYGVVMVQIDQVVVFEFLMDNMLFVGNVCFIDFVGEIVGIDMLDVFMEFFCCCFDGGGV